jgi:hypothetical protein
VPDNVIGLLSCDEFVDLVTFPKDRKAQESLLAFAGQKFGKMTTGVSRARPAQRATTVDEGMTSRSIPVPPTAARGT